MAAAAQTTVTLQDLLATPKFYALDPEERRSALKLAAPERFGGMEPIEQDRFLALVDLKRQRETAPAVPGMERLGPLPEAGRAPVVPGLDVPEATGPIVAEPEMEALGEVVRPLVGKAVEAVKRLRVAPSLTTPVVEAAPRPGQPQPAPLQGWSPAERVADFVDDFVQRNITGRQAKTLEEPTFRFDLLFPPEAPGETALQTGMRSAAEQASGFTSAESLLGATALGSLQAIPRVGQVLYRGALAVIGGVAGVGAGKATVSGAEKYLAGDPHGAAKDWGFAGVDALLSALALRAAARGLPELQDAFREAREGRQRTAADLQAPGGTAGGPPGRGPQPGKPPSEPGPAVKRQVVQVQDAQGRLVEVETEAKGPAPTKDQVSLLDQIIDETLRHQRAGEATGRPLEAPPGTQVARVPESQPVVADLVRAGVDRRTAEAIRAAAEREIQLQKGADLPLKEAVPAKVEPAVVAAPAQAPAEEIPSQLGKAVEPGVFRHWTTPESAAALEAGQPFEATRAPVHGMAPGLGRETGTGKEAGDRLYLSLDDERWSKVEVRTGEGQVVEGTEENVHQGRPFYDYDQQKWMVELGAWETRDLAPVSYRVDPKATVLTIDSEDSLRAAVREATEVAGKRVFPVDDPNFWDALAKRYDAVALRNVRELAGQDIKFFKAASGDQLVILNPKVARLASAAGKVAEQVVERVPAAAERGAAAPAAEPHRLKPVPRLGKDQALMVEAVKRQTDAIEKYASLEIARGTAPERRKALETYVRSLQHYAAQLGLTVPEPAKTPEAMRQAARQVRAELDAALEASGVKKPARKVAPKNAIVIAGLRQAAGKLTAAIDRLKSVPRAKGRGQRSQEDLAREAGRLERLQGTLRALAEAMEADRLPPSLAKVRNRTQVQQLLELEHYPGPGPLKTAGMNDEAGFDEARGDLLKLAPAAAELKPAAPVVAPKAKPEPVAAAAAPAKPTPVKAKPEVAPQAKPPAPEKPLEPAKARVSAREVKHKRVVAGLAVRMESGDATAILVPGEDRRYPAQYRLIEAADLVTSHDPNTFQPNPEYPYVNDRDYTKAVNQQRVRLNRSPAKFDPAWLVTDDPGPEQGPTMIDRYGRPLGGNGRALILKWVYEHEPGLAQKYRDYLAGKARNFGLDPVRLNEFRQPVLVRVIQTPDEELDPQEAITDLNKTGTAALTPAERALADSRRVSQETLDFIAGKIDEQGPEGTLLQALEGDGGPAVIARLVADGVITDQAKGEYIEERAVKGTARKYELVTEEGKRRIARLLVGRLFRDTNQFEAAPPELRAKLERLVAPIVRVAQRGDWNILGWVREAIDLLEEMRAHGVRSVADYIGQATLWPTTEGYSQPAIAIAKTLQLGPVNAAKVFRAFAGEEANGRPGAPASFFTPLTPEEAFRAAFIEKREEIEKAERRPKAKGAGAGEPVVFMREQLPAAFERTARRGETWHLRGKPLKPWRGYDTGREMGADAEARLIQGGTQDPTLVLVNQQAMLVLQEAEQVHGPLGGWLMEAYRVTRVIRRLRTVRDSAANAFADVLEAAGAETGHVVVVQAGPTAVRAARHEVHHAQQFQISPEVRNLMGEDGAVYFLTDPLADAATDNLISRGYPRDTEILAAELGAHLAEGPVGWRLLGLDREQARYLIRRYLEYIVAAHGREALAVFRRAAPDFRRVLADVQRLSEQPGEAARGLPGGELRRDVRQDVSGRPAEAGPTLQRELFPDFDTGKQREAEAEQQRRIEAERLTAEFNSALTRQNARRKLRKAAGVTQPGLFSEEPAPPQGELFDPKFDALPEEGLFGDEPLLMRMITPAPAAAAAPVASVSGPVTGEPSPMIEGLRAAADAVREFRQDVRKTFAPASLDVMARQSALSLRAHGAETARAFDHAEAALRKARKFFRGQPHEFVSTFIHRMEEGQAQENTDLDAIAGLFRNLLDNHRREVQGLGEGKLTAYYETYFPHIWKRRSTEERTKIWRAIFGRRPLEGPKAFLKKRTYLFFREGLEAGLEPVSWNPVDLVLLKLREMDRFLLAHRFIREMKDLGLARFVPALGGRPPFGWTETPDPIGTVWGPPEIKVREAFDAEMMRGLEEFAKSLGITHERLATLRGPAWGYAQPGKGEVKTRFAGPESVLVHEIGHVLDHRYKLSQQVVKTKPHREELRLLADLRLGGEPPAHFRRYVRRKAEKMANLVAAYVHAPEAFERVAPATFTWFEDFIEAHPELARLKEIRYGMELAEGSATYPLGGFVLKGKWFMPESAVVVLKNFLSPGLRQKGWFRPLLGSANLMVQWSLSFSGFHLGFTSVDAATSKLAIALKYLAAGMPLKAVQRVLEVPISPVQNVLKGNKVIREWFAATNQDPETVKIIEAMLAGGGRARMDPVYRTKFRERLADFWTAKNPAGVLLTALPAVMETAAWPIMEWVVPRQKLGVFADMAQFELARLPQNATREEVRQVFARCWDSVDNRMGQLVYDDLFWNRAVKDLGMISVQSLGWNLGTFRELGGGYIDYARQAGRIGRRIVGRRPAPPAGGEPPAGGGPPPEFGAPGRPEFTHRMAYVLALPMLIGFMGAVYAYLRWGRLPDDRKDYFFPRTGNYDEQGRPERFSWPGYMKDQVHWLGLGLGQAHPLQAARNKLNPLVGRTADVLTNEDFWGTMIHDPHDPAYKQVLDSLKYFTGIRPYAFQNIQRERQRGAGVAMQVLPMIGITAAPSYVTQTPAEALQAELLGERRPAGAQPKESYARARARADVAQALRQHKPAGPIIAEQMKAGNLTREDLVRVLRQATTDRFTRGFKSLGLDQALDVWQLANAEERGKVRGVLILKVLSGLQTKSPEELSVLRQHHGAAIRDLVKGGQKP